MDIIRLRKLRTEHKRSQQDVADFLGITRQGYGSYESGKTEPDHDTLIRIADYFEVSTDYLVGRSIARSPGGGQAYADGGANWTQEEKDAAAAYIEMLRQQKKARTDREQGN